MIYLPPRSGIGLGHNEQLSSEALGPEIGGDLLEQETDSAGGSQANNPTEPGSARTSGVTMR